MELLIIQHEASTTPGTTLKWASEQNISYKVWKAWEEPFEEYLLNIPNVIVCGGTMDTHEEDLHPWMKQEKKLIKNAIETNKKYFGICLGGQLLAEQMGAKVFECPSWEIGWWPVVSGVKDSNLSSVLAFHWHKFNFEIPQGAQNFLSSEHCLNQAFKYSQNIMAVQFHPEVDKKWILDSIENYRIEKYFGQIQTREQMAQDLDQKLEATQRWYFKALDNWYF